MLKAYPSAVLYLLLCAVLTIPGCATNPVTGKRQLMFTSEEKEIEMGKSYDPQVVAEMGLYENPEMQRFLNEKGQLMASISERPQLPWTFRLVDSEVVNAFAVPGGFIYFTRGIMAHFNNEAQFAGVLGHEIGHVTARHTVAQQAKQTIGQLGLIGGMIAVPGLAQQGQSLMQGMQLLFLKFGRDAESQSDQLGVAYSTRIGYDSKEMAGFFRTLDRLSGGAENRAPTFTSTHPDPANREQNVLALTEEYQNAFPAADGEYAVNRESYLRLIDGMIYGTDPKNGYVENSAFYHPDLRFKFSIARNWRLLNAPTQVQVVAPDQNSVLQMTLAQGTDTRGTAQQFVNQTKIQVRNSSDAPINGLPATTLIGEVTQQTQQGQAQALGVIASFIAWGGNTYVFTGLAQARQFNRYQRDLESMIASFSELRDQSKINRQAERLRIFTNPRQQSLQEALLGAGVPQDRLQEFSVLNGYQLTTTVPAGYLLKSFSGGK